MRTILGLVAAALAAQLCLSSVLFAQLSEEAMLAEGMNQFLKGKYYFATTWLERVLRDNPSPHQRREVLVLISKAYARSGRTQKAADNLQTLLKDFPDAAASLEPELLALAGSGSRGPTSPSAPSARPLQPAAPLHGSAKASAAPETAVTAPPLAEKGLRHPVSGPVAGTASLPTPPADGNFAAKISSGTAGEAIPEPVSVHRASQAPALPGPEKHAVAADRAGESYTVIAGETVNRKKMGVLRDRLKAAGLQPIVRETHKEMDVYRLLEKCFAGRMSAESRLNLVSRQIRDAFIISDGGSYCVVAGSLMSAEAARQAQKRLAQTGLTADIAKFRVTLPVWQVSAGQYSDARIAEQAAKSLSAQGIAATIDKIKN